MKKQVLISLIALASFSLKAQTESYHSPERATSTLQWCGSFDDYNIFGGSANYQIAALWKASDLVDYKNWYVEKFSFMPVEEDCEYKLMIWDAETGSQVLSSTVLNNDELHFMEKNTVKLQTPLQLKEGKSYYFGIGIKTAMGRHPLGQDKGSALQGKGDLFRLTNANGQPSGGFISLSANYPQMNYNWLLAIHLSSETGLEQTLSNETAVYLSDGRIHAGTSASELMLFDMQGRLIGRRKGNSIEAPVQKGQYILVFDAQSVKLNI